MSVAILKTRTTENFAERFARIAQRNRRPIAEEMRIALERHVELETTKPRKDGRNA